MKILISILSVSFLLFCSSCQKPLQEVDYIYVGDWGSKTFAIEIFENGFARWQSNQIVGDKSGRVTIEKGRLNLGHAISFKIDTPPMLDTITGKTYMVLNGETFNKH